MLHATFLDAYCRDLPPESIHGSAHIPEIQIAQLHSYVHGQVLYDVLSGAQANHSATFARLHAQANALPFEKIEQALLQTPEDWQYRNEVNFYGLNACMRPMWLPLIFGDWLSEHIRNAAIQSSMNALALCGLEYFVVLDRCARAYGTETLFNAQNNFGVRRIFGALQEIDGSIVGLNFILRHPNMTMVPAPMQFERSAGGANADLLTIDFLGKRAVGLQITANTKKAKLEKYDNERIVVIEGPGDLGATRVVRVHCNGKPKIKCKPWPGRISAAHILSLPVAEDPAQSQPNLAGYLLAKKAEAFHHLDTTPPDCDALSQKIGERILAKL